MIPNLGADGSAEQSETQLYVFVVNDEHVPVLRRVRFLRERIIHEGFTEAHSHTCILDAAKLVDLRTRFRCVMTHAEEAGLQSRVLYGDNRLAHWCRLELLLVLDSLRGGRDGVKVGVGVDEVTV